MKAKRYIKMAVIYLTGIVSGAFLHIGYAVFTERPASFGGELLILPLIVLLLYLGFTIGREAKDWGLYRRGYSEGYHDAHHNSNATQGL